MVNYLLKRFFELRKNILYFIYFKQIYFTFAHIYTFLIGGFPGGSGVKNLPAVQEIQEMRVWSLGQHYPLEEEMTKHSNILARINSMDRGAWQAIVHGITKSRTWLSMHTYISCILNFLCRFMFSCRGFLHSSVSKESACNAGNPGSTPGLGRSPGEGNGNPFQYSCLENPMDQRA